LPEARQCGEEAGKKDGSSTTKPVIKWDGKPAANECTAEIGGRIDQTQEPSRSRVFATNSKVLTVKELGAINDSLIYRDVSK
jgi:hypothetical protein